MKYQLPVLMYHRVVRSRNNAGKHKIWVKEKELIRQFSYLKQNGYHPITFHDLHKTIPAFEKPVILTFDDGYEDNYSVLFPLLKQFGFTAVIYLVTKLKRNEWGIREGEPELLMLNEAQIREMDEYGIEFGGHTQHHLALGEIAINDARQEIIGCKKDIEQLIKHPVISFAYPFGSLNEQVKRVVDEAGFNFGISTTSGPKVIFEDPFEIRRMDVNNKTSFMSFKSKVSGHYFEPSFFSFLHSDK